jgi:SAM-dependent methyltransferase
VQVHTDYERLAERFDEDRARWSVPPDDIVAALVESRTRVRVLDLGCGTGRWLAAQRHAHADRAVTWLGADPSSAMLDEARVKGLGCLVRARAEDLPFRSASVDCISTSYAFHHFVDKDGALDEIARVLDGVGVLVINNIEPSTAQGWWVYEHFPETIAIDAARFWPSARIAGALDARRFDVDIDIDSGVVDIPAADAVVEAERRVVSQLALLDDTAYERGLRRLREIATAPDATVTTTRSRVRVVARRR